MNDRQGSAAMFKAQVAERAQHGWITGRNRALVHEWKEHIADQLACGYTWKVVWRALKDMGYISMSYNSFRRHCRAVGLERADGRAKPAKLGRKPERSSRDGRSVPHRIQQRGFARDVPLPQGEFVHPNDVDLSQFYKKKDGAR